MKKIALNWFDKMMLSVTFAEAGVAEPDVSHIKTEATDNLTPSDREEVIAPYDSEVVPAQ